MAGTDLGSGTPWPVTLVVPGTPNISTGSVDATGTQLLAANPYRRWGVFIQNTDSVLTDNLKVGTVTGDAVLLLAPPSNAVNTPNTVFIPGTGAVFAKSSNGTLTTDYTLMWL